MLFAPFRKATRPETPGFLQAEISRANFDQRAKNEANALRSGNLIGGAEVYNEAMGDKSPIADYMFGAEEAAAGAGEAASTVLPNAGTALEVGTSAGTGAAGGVLPAAEAASSAVPLAAGTTAGTGGAGLAALQAAMGPVGWAALLSSVLLG